MKKLSWPQRFLVIGADVLMLLFFTAMVCVASVSIQPVREYIERWFDVTDQSITITFLPVPVDAPHDFTVTYITDYQVDADWTKPPNADKTMVRAKYGEPPAEPVPGNPPSDGYLIYYDTGTAASDTAINLDEYFGKIYYRAWSQTAGGIWSPIYADGEMEAPTLANLTSILSSFFVFLIVAFLIWLANKLDSVFLNILAGFVSIGFGAYWIWQGEFVIYTIEGVALVCVGIYMLGMVGYYFIDRARGRGS